MSWAEVKKINDNVKRPLNKQIRDSLYKGIQIITKSTTWKASRDGYYKIIVVGSGGATGTTNSGLSPTYHHIATGGGGGVAIKTLYTTTENSHTITISADASFDSITAYCGGSGNAYSSVPGAGGTASGGDENYTGLSGKYQRETSNYWDSHFLHGGDVGVMIPEFITSGVLYHAYLNGSIATITTNLMGYGLAGSYGGVESYAKGACVIIIPLELEE